jgi:leader peptidase (prepilin peptidase)/N-methyltransferase|tara:strand:- start:251 stop:739 length:489 start_codon:yes stop_codon:yes gene_type:complete
MLMALMLWANLFSSLIELLIIFLVISSLYAQFILDLKHLLLSVYLSIKVLILGLIINYSGFFTDIQSAILGFMAGYLSLFLINKVFYCFRKKEGIGGGDFILLASIGALLGYQMLSFVVLLGSLFSLLIYLLKRSNFENRVPFGSGLALSALLIILIKISVV